MSGLKEYEILMVTFDNGDTWQLHEDTHETAKAAIEKATANHVEGDAYVMNAVLKAIVRTNAIISN